MQNAIPFTLDVNGVTARRSFLMPSGGIYWVDLGNGRLGYLHRDGTGLALDNPTAAQMESLLAEMTEESPAVDKTEPKGYGWAV